MKLEGGSGYVHSLTEPSRTEELIIQISHRPSNPTSTELDVPDELEDLGKQSLSSVMRMPLI